MNTFLNVVQQATSTFTRSPEKEKMENSDNRIKGLQLVHNILEEMASDPTIEHKNPLVQAALEIWGAVPDVDHSAINHDDIMKSSAVQQIYPKVMELGKKCHEIGLKLPVPAILARKAEIDDNVLIDTFGPELHTMWQQAKKTSNAAPTGVAVAVEIETVAEVNVINANGTSTTEVEKLEKDSGKDVKIDVNVINTNEKNNDAKETSANDLPPSNKKPDETIVVGIEDSDTLRSTKFAQIKQLNVELKRLATNPTFKKSLEKPMVKVALDIWGDTGVDHTAVDPDTIKSCSGVQQIYPMLTDLVQMCNAIKMKLPVKLLIEMKWELDVETMISCPSLGKEIATAWTQLRIDSRRKIKGLRLVHYLLKQMSSDYTTKNNVKNPLVKAALEIWGAVPDVDHSAINHDDIMNSLAVQQIYPMVMELANACQPVGLKLPVAVILASKAEIEENVLIDTFGTELHTMWKRAKKALDDGNSTYNGMPIHTWGPRLWHEVHTKGMYPISYDSNDFATKFASRIPCEKCASHYRQMITEHPPPVPIVVPVPVPSTTSETKSTTESTADTTKAETTTTSPVAGSTTATATTTDESTTTSATPTPASIDGLFTWTVMIHNLVNVRLSKPQWKQEEAFLSYAPC